jgi:hypothetical protein
MNDYQLRWVKRAVPIPRYSESIGSLVMVLQHRSEHMVDRVGNEGVWEWTEWDDVPTKDE